MDDDVGNDNGHVGAGSRVPYDRSQRTGLRLSRSPHIDNANKQEEIKEIHNHSIQQRERFRLLLRGFRARRILDFGPAPHGDRTANRPLYNQGSGEKRPVKTSLHPRRRSDEIEMCSSEPSSANWRTPWKEDVVAFSASHRMTGCSSSTDAILIVRRGRYIDDRCDVRWSDDFVLMSVSPSMLVVVIKHWLLWDASLVPNKTMSQGTSSFFRILMISPACQ